jgi:hypothetical protein
MERHWLALLPRNATAGRALAQVARVAAEIGPQRKGKIGIRAVVGGRRGCTGREANCSGQDEGAQHWRIEDPRLTIRKPAPKG